MPSLALDLAAALDPVVYAQRLGFIPDPWQADMLRSSAPQFMLNVTRQGGKSTTTALKVLHKAEYQPGALILLLSPSERQSKEIMLKVKDFHKLSDVRADSDTILSLVLPNESRIVALPGKEGTIRGFSGVNLIVIDEAARVPDELYYAVRPMLAVSGGQLALLSTPFGKKGFFFEEWSQGEGWERFMIDATQCPRITPEFLEHERRTIPIWRFRQEYMCSFEETEFSAFSYDDVQAMLREEVEVWNL